LGLAGAGTRSSPAPGNGVAWPPIARPGPGLPLSGALSSPAGPVPLVPPAKGKGLAYVGVERSTDDGPEGGDDSPALDVLRGPGDGLSGTDLGPEETELPLGNGFA
jgi:hypothetical protein